MPDYRGGDVDVRTVGRVALFIVGAIVFALAASWLMLRERGPAANTPPHVFSGAAPLLQPAPQSERAAYFDEKRRLTGSAGWVDRRAGIARIPLDAAMRLQAARAAAAQPAKEGQ
jgi:hypothetical protein